MIKVVLFDSGGVVVTTGHYKKRFMDLVEKTYGNVDLSFDDVYFIFITLEKGSISEKEAITELTKKIGRKPNEYASSLFSKAAHALHLRPTIIKLIKEIKNRNIKTGVLSNAIEANAKRHKKLGHYTLFDYKILSHEIGMRKPDESIYRYTLEMINVNPCEILFIDDSIENIDTAKKLGFTTIFFKNVYTLEKELKNYHVL